MSIPPSCLLNNQILDNSQNFNLNEMCNIVNNNNNNRTQTTTTVTTTALDIEIGDDIATADDDDDGNKNDDDEDNAGSRTPTASDSLERHQQDCFINTEQMHRQVAGPQQKSCKRINVPQQQNKQQAAAITELTSAINDAHIRKTAATKTTMPSRPPTQPANLAQLQRTPNEYTENIFPHIAETNRQLRAALVSINEVNFEQKVHKAIIHYISGIRATFEDACASALICRKLARSLTRTLDLIHSICTTYSDTYVFMYRMSELVAFYVTCELSLARGIQDKTSIVNRISNVMRRHLTVKNQKDATVENILRMFVLMSRNYKENDIMIPLFSNFITRPIVIMQKELPDKLYIQYIIVFYQWKQLETSQEAREDIISFADKFMRPARTLSTNATYAYHLPKYTVRSTATRFILENLKFFQDLRNASIYDNSLKCTEGVIDFSEDDPVLESRKKPPLHASNTFTAAMLMPNQQPRLTGGQSTDPVKYEEPTIVETVDLTSRPAENAGIQQEDIELQYIRDLVLKAKRVIPTHQIRSWLEKHQQQHQDFSDTAELNSLDATPSAVIEIDSDDDAGIAPAGSATKRVAHGELFSLDFDNAMGNYDSDWLDDDDDNNETQNLEKNTSKANEQQQTSTAAADVREDPTDPTKFVCRFIESNLRTYVANKRSKEAQQQLPEHNQSRINNEQCQQRLSLEPTVLNEVELISNTDESFDSSVPSHFTMPRIVDAFSCHDDSKDFPLLPQMLNEDGLPPSSCDDSESQQLSLASANSINTAFEADDDYEFNFFRNTLPISSSPNISASSVASSSGEAVRPNHETTIFSTNKVIYSQSTSNLQVSQRRNLHSSPLNGVQQQQQQQQSSTTARKHVKFNEVPVGPTTSPITAATRSIKSAIPAKSNLVRNNSNTNSNSDTSVASYSIPNPPSTQHQPVTLATSSGATLQPQPQPQKSTKQQQQHQELTRQHQANADTIRISNSSIASTTSSEQSESLLDSLRREQLSAIPKIFSKFGPFKSITTATTTTKTTTKKTSKKTSPTRTTLLHPKTSPKRNSKSKSDTTLSKPYSNTAKQQNHSSLIKSQENSNTNYDTTLPAFKSPATATPSSTSNKKPKEAKTCTAQTDSNVQNQNKRKKKATTTTTTTTAPSGGRSKGYKPKNDPKLNTLQCSVVLERSPQVNTKMEAAYINSLLQMQREALRKRALERKLKMQSQMDLANARYKEHQLLLQPRPPSVAKFSHSCSLLRPVTLPASKPPLQEFCELHDDYKAETVLKKIAPLTNLMSPTHGIKNVFDQRHNTKTGREDKQLQQQQVPVPRVPPQLKLEAFHDKVHVHRLMMEQSFARRRLQINQANEANEPNVTAIRSKSVPLSDSNSSLEKEPSPTKSVLVRVQRIKLDKIKSPGQGEQEVPAKKRKQTNSNTIVARIDETLQQAVESAVKVEKTRKSKKAKSANKDQDTDSSDKVSFDTKSNTIVLPTTCHSLSKDFYSKCCSSTANTATDSTNSESSIVLSASSVKTSKQQRTLQQTQHNDETASTMLRPGHDATLKTTTTGAVRSSQNKTKTPQNIVSNVFGSRKSNAIAWSKMVTAPPNRLAMLATTASDSSRSSLLESTFKITVEPKLTPKPTEAAMIATTQLSPPDNDINTINVLDSAALSTAIASTETTEEDLIDAATATTASNQEVIVTISTAPRLLSSTNVGAVPLVNTSDASTSTSNSPTPSLATISTATTNSISSSPVVHMESTTNSSEVDSKQEHETSTQAAPATAASASPYSIANSTSCSMTTPRTNVAQDLHFIECMVSAGLKASTVATLINFEATPTVPAYLFNGESRDVPTPTSTPTPTRQPTPTPMTTKSKQQQPIALTTAASSICATLDSTPQEVEAQIDSTHMHTTRLYEDTTRLMTSDAEVSSTQDEKPAEHIPLGKKDNEDDLLQQGIRIKDANDDADNGISEDVCLELREQTGTGDHFNQIDSEQLVKLCSQQATPQVTKPTIRQQTLNASKNFSLSKENSAPRTSSSAHVETMQSMTLVVQNNQVDTTNFHDVYVGLSYESGGSGVSLSGASGESSGGVNIEGAAYRSFLRRRKLSTMSSSSSTADAPTLPATSGGSQSVPKIIVRTMLHDQSADLLEHNMENKEQLQGSQSSLDRENSTLSIKELPLHKGKRISAGLVGFLNGALHDEKLTEASNKSPKKRKSTQESGQQLGRSRGSRKVLKESPKRSPESQIKSKKLTSSTRNNNDDSTNDEQLQEVSKNLSPNSGTDATANTLLSKAADDVSKNINGSNLSHCDTALRSKSPLITSPRSASSNLPIVTNSPSTKRKHVQDESATSSKTLSPGSSKKRKVEATSGNQEVAFIPAIPNYRHKLLLTREAKAPAKSDSAEMHLRASCEEQTASTLKYRHKLQQIRATAANKRETSDSDIAAPDSGDNLKTPTLSSDASEPEVAVDSYEQHDELKAQCKQKLTKAESGKPAIPTSTPNQAVVRNTIPKLTIKQQLMLSKEAKCKEKLTAIVKAAAAGGNVLNNSAVKQTNAKESSQNTKSAAAERKKLSKQCPNAPAAVTATAVIAKPNKEPDKVPLHKKLTARTTAMDNRSAASKAKQPKDSGVEQRVREKTTKIAAKCATAATANAEESPKSRSKSKLGNRAAEQASGQRQLSAGSIKAQASQSQANKSAVIAGNGKHDIPGKQQRTSAANAPINEKISETAIKPRNSTKQQQQLQPATTVGLCSTPTVNRRQRTAVAVLHNEMVEFSNSLSARRATPAKTSGGEPNNKTNFNNNDNDNMNNNLITPAHTLSSFVHTATTPAYTTSTERRSPSTTKLFKIMNSAKTKVAALPTLDATADAADTIAGSNVITPTFADVATTTSKAMAPELPKSAARKRRPVFK